MEKGFNDDELADIMSEIESLEQDFEHETSSQEQTESVDEPVQEQPETQEVVAQEQHDEPEVQPEPEVHEEVHASQHDEPESHQEPEQVVEEESWQEDKVQPMSAHSDEEEDEVDEEMNEVLDELSQMPVEDVTPKHTKEDDNIHHFKGGEKVSENNKSQTAMSFHVEGDMKLELSFHIGDQFIGVNITDEGLVVGLDGGAKFTIPVNQQASKKAA